MPVFLAIRDSELLRSRMAFRLTLLEPIDSTFCGQYQYSDKVNRNTGRLQSTSTKVRNVPVSISSFYTRHHNNVSPFNDVQMHFVFEKPGEKILYLNKM